MKFYELLKFSFLNLWRRKLRTSLTLLGVMIGTASIVVMMSLGIGLNYSYMQQIENSSTLTLITVSSYGGGYYGGGYAVSSTADAGSNSEQVKLDADAIELFKNLEHVSVASPVYQFDVIAFSGKYQGYLNISALDHEMLEALKLPILEGTLPAEGEELQLIAGKQVGYNFYDPNGSSDMYYGWGGGDSEPTVDMYD